MQTSKHQSQIPMHLTWAPVVNNSVRVLTKQRLKATLTTLAKAIYFIAVYNSWYFKLTF